MQQQNMTTKGTQIQNLRKFRSNIVRKNNNIPAMNIENRREMILNKQSSFRVQEAYKALRTNLLFSLPADGCKKIIVTSAFASEGKSTNCLNLAITFAEMNAKVLVIDCDLRKSGLTRLVENKKTPGLSNYLAGMNSLDEVLVKSEYENLSYIQAGSVPPNPIELLSVERMGTMVKELEKQYDYIFFDTAPINVVADTMVVSKYADGVVLVILQNSTDKDSIDTTLEKLSFAGAKVLGFVLNGVTYGRKGKKNKKERYYYSENRV